ncbi:MAG: LamG domain-containing protein [Myxococcales bacterium]|nr:LamG domain-containing protein [Myxococcales bacterium]
MRHLFALASVSIGCALIACSGDDSGTADNAPGGNAGASGTVDTPSDTPGMGDDSTGQDAQDGSSQSPPSSQNPMTGDDSSRGDGDGASGDDSQSNDDPPASGDPAPAASLEDGLLAHYTFDGGDLSDQSGNGHDAVLGRDATCDGVDGAFGGGCRLEGRGFLQVDTTPVPAMTEAGLSASAWINPDEINMSKYVFAVGTELFGAKFARNGVLCILKDVNGFQPLPLSAPTINQSGWHHVACVYDRQAGTFTAYANGEPGEAMDVSAFTSLSERNREMGIGCMPDPPACEMANPFTPMAVDDLRLWDRPLSADEVQALAGAR